jgi:hypothetical protein
MGATPGFVDSGGRPRVTADWICGPLKINHIRAGTQNALTESIFIKVSRLTKERAGDFSVGDEVEDPIIVSGKNKAFVA